MIEALIAALAAGLQLWAHKDKTKYADQLIELKLAWYEETNKPDSDRSDAAIDAIEWQLRVLALGFAADAGQANAPSTA